MTSAQIHLATITSTMIQSRKIGVPSQRTPERHPLEPTSPLQLPKPIVLSATAFNSDPKSLLRKPPQARLTLPRTVASSSWPTKAISLMASNSFSKVSSAPSSWYQLLRWSQFVNNCLTQSGLTTLMPHFARPTCRSLDSTPLSVKLLPIYHLVFCPARIQIIKPQISLSMSDGS